jgi:hypothetical protein
MSIMIAVRISVVAYTRMIMLFVISAMASAAG